PYRYPPSLLDALPIFLRATEHGVLGVVFAEPLGEVVAAVEPRHLVEAPRPHGLIHRAVTQVEEVAGKLADPRLDLVPQLRGDLQVSRHSLVVPGVTGREDIGGRGDVGPVVDRKSTRLNSSHG